MSIKQQLHRELALQKITPAQELQSIVLVGGLGKRLNKERKLISPQNFPQIDSQFYHQYGAKGMTILNLKEGKKTITDKHLEIHYATKEIKSITLALGCQPQIFQNYYQDSSLSFLIEKNPAGTIAPLVKLWYKNKLTSTPLVYANGDNLIDIDFYQVYLQGLLKAQKLGLSLDNLVIDILAQMPYEESMNYGTVDLDKNTGLVKGFYEKAPLEQGRNLKEYVPINSGFSIICNPYQLIKNHLNQEVITTSQALEQQKLDYSQYEKIVKYETFYETLATKNLMVGVLADSYWTDLGTEEKLIACEKHFV